MDPDRFCEAVNNPKDKRILELAKIADGKGHSASAFELFKLVISADPKKDSAIYRAVKNLIEVGRISDAESYLNIIRRNAAPKPWLIELVLGELCMARSKPADAETHFRNAWQMNRQSTVPAIYLADALFKQEKFNDAKSVLLKALMAKGDVDEVYLNLGCVARALGEYADARSYFLKALEISPDYSQAKRGLADVEYWLNFIKKVRAD
jgi:tetratricopeptide (TPR) repeat protein